jgi:transcriptional regulator with XRE-family HTH domain
MFVLLFGLARHDGREEGGAMGEGRRRVSRRRPEGEATAEELASRLGQAGKKRQFVPTPLGVKVKAWRVERGWTQTHLARRAGIDQGFISQVEKGGIENVSVPYLRALAKGFDMPLTELLAAAGILDAEDLAREEQPGLDALYGRLRADPVMLDFLRRLAGSAEAATYIEDLRDALALQLRAILRGLGTPGEREAEEGEK